MRPRVSSGMASPVAGMPVGVREHNQRTGASEVFASVQERGRGGVREPWAGRFGFLRQSWAVALVGQPGTGPAALPLVTQPVIVAPCLVA